jgi:hypothetical protein
MFVHAKRNEQSEARRLRREQGWALARIAAELGVSKSSVSVWVRDIPVPRISRRTYSAPPRPPGAVSAVSLRVWRSGGVRRCGRCRQTLPLEFFNRLGSGHQWWCRACFRAYFRERGAKHLHQSGAAKEARVNAAREHVMWRLSTACCQDCGETDRVVLEFDHLRDKAEAVAVLMANGAPLTALDEEIEKCEVVCVNCHRHRTGRRAGWRRSASRWWETPAPPGRAVARNVAYVYSLLERSSCVDCGLRDLVVLEFDHIGEKRMNVTRLAWNGASLTTLEEEIDRCEVRCGNCHRRRTARVGGHRRAVDAP